MRHLWEYDHSFYCEEAGPDRRERCDSWLAFTETLRFDGDRDMNLLFRWDWCHDSSSAAPDELALFFMHQRKGQFWSVTIQVTAEDEPAVRTWLYECAVAMRETWEPFLDALDGPATMPKEA